GISLGAGFLRLQVVRRVVEDGIDFVLRNEANDVDRLRRFHVGALKVLILNYDVLVFFILVSLHDLVPRYLLGVGLSHAFVIDGTQIGFSQEVKLQVLPARGGIEGNGNVNQPETNGAFPNRSHKEPYRGTTGSAIRVMTHETVAQTSKSAVSP